MGPAGTAALTTFQRSGRLDAANLLVDARVRAVPWRDLVFLRPAERLRELLLPVPWLVVALLAANRSLWILALLASFYFFLAGLRLVHDTFHGNLGLRAWANDAVLLVLSALMLARCTPCASRTCNIIASVWE
jgi:fatty acid desaturase